jgi:pimeloyl-ACP methyl ester carboxylesterase
VTPRELVLTTAGGAFRALELGATPARPVVFLHGFPDHPPTAIPFLADLAQRGHRVLAPWLRGYAPSPLDGPYDPETLVTDVLALIEQWSPDAPVALVGHDWGALLTYLACSRAAAKISRAVTLAMPHPATFVRALRRPAQVRASWYAMRFQLPGAAAKVRRNDYAFIDRLWRTWSPGFELPIEQRQALHAMLDASMPAPISYYGAAVRHGRAVLARHRAPIATPLLALHGAADGCVLARDDVDHARFAGPYTREILPGLGHFLHVEDPALLAARAARWLG